MTLPDGRRGPHVFVADLEQPDLAADDRHHLARVLRLRDGDELTVSDGAGRWRTCVFAPGLLPVTSEIEHHDAPTRRLTVAFALTKASKPELVVQKLTELGIDAIVPFASARSVVRWDEAKADRQHERFQRVAREAAMQSRRVRLPDVHHLTSFDAVVALPGAHLAERSGGQLGAEVSTLVIGPEGGWDDVERVALPTVGLGTNVLRAETAAIAAGTLLAAVRAGVVGS